MIKLEALKEGSAGDSEVTIGDLLTWFVCGFGFYMAWDLAASLVKSFKK